MPRDENCSKCGLCESSHNVCVWGDGDGEAFVVGEAPGKEEARTGKPFMGKAGMFGRPILADYGLENPYITNAVKCRPPDNRKPEPSELKACKPYLQEEIATRKPKAILLWGATAMRQTIGRTGITEMNGQVIEKDGQTYVPCFHPAYVLRDPSKEPAFRMAVARYAEVLHGTHTGEMPESRPIERETIDQFIDDWVAAREVAFDTEGAGEEEGDGLAWWKEGFDITSIAFSLLVKQGKRLIEKNWWLAMPGHPQAVLSRELTREFLVELTRSTGGKKVSAHNGKYDNLALMQTYGVRFHLDDDTMLAHHLIDENSHHGLKLLARQHLGAPDYDLTRKEIRDTRAVPAKRLGEYNAGDTAFTRRLRPIFNAKMDEQEEWLYRRVIMPAARLFEDIERDGHYIDIDYLNKSADEEYAKLQAVEKELAKVAGREINWNSPSQVAQLLFGDLKLTPTVLTPKGKPSTAEDALVDIDHPVAKMLERYRGHDKFLSTYTGRPQEDGTYVGGWREFMDGPHLYVSTKLHGTVTGRYSGRLHSTPRDGTIRNAVTAPDGWTFCQLDLSQAELRTIAIMSRDPTMIDIFRRGDDAHWYTLMDAIAAGGGDPELVFSTAKVLNRGKKLPYDDAIELLRHTHHDKVIAIDGAWKEWRKKAKGINFGFAYGQQAPGFIEFAKAKYDFEPTLREATDFRNAYFNTYQAIPAWHERQKRLVRLDGSVRSMSGRLRRLPGIFSSDRSVVAECERQAINSPVQGFIGDYKAMILVELGESIPRTHMRLRGEHHDAILMWLKNEYIEDVLPQIHHIAEHPRLAKEAGLNFPIPMTADIELGRWGKGTKWKPS